MDGEEVAGPEAPDHLQEGVAVPPADTGPGGRGTPAPPGGGWCVARGAPRSRAPGRESTDGLGCASGSMFPLTRAKVRFREKPLTGSGI